MIIYLVTNRINGKQYVGQTINSLKQRKGEHQLSKRICYFHSALKKYSIENFIWSILYECDDIEELNKLEVYYIKLYGTFVDSIVGGYNLTTGGYNRIVSKETRKKLSEAGKKRDYDHEHLDRIRLLTKKWHASEEGRRWHSEHAKGKMDADIETRCIECGKIYMAKTKASLYCHNNCKAKYNRRIRKERYNLSDYKRYRYAT